MPEDGQKSESDDVDEGNSEDSETETDALTAEETGGEEEAVEDEAVEAAAETDAEEEETDETDVEEEDTEEADAEEGTAVSAATDGEAQSGVATSDDKAPKGADEVYCSSCGAVIKEQAEVCPECGVRQQSASSTEEKNPVLAAVLSFIIPGAGQIYNGQIARGAVFLVVFFINILLAFVLIGVFTQLITVVIAVYDAYNQAQKINAGEVQV